MNDALDRHSKIALQFSGGKDSSACLQLLRDELHRITVYHLSTEDHDPCKAEVLSWAKSIAPNFEVIETSTPPNTIASDLVPSNATAFGQHVLGTAGPVIIDRFSCCYATVMLPLQLRMMEDGITLIIRGQKVADRRKGVFRSGDVKDGIEFLFPVEDWDDERVFQFLRESEVPIAPVYEYLDTLPECLTCSGWWDDHRTKYLQQNYPVRAAVLEQRLTYIRAMVADEIKHLDT